MQKLIPIILMSVASFGCQTSPTQVNRTSSLTSPPKTPPVQAEKPKVYGYWSPLVSRIFCVTGALAVKYDDTLGILDEGTFDKLAKGYKWRDENQLKVIESNLENIAGTTVYSVRYKSGPLYMKQRVAYGESESHKELSRSDKYFTEKGYKRMNGEISIGNETSDNPSVCWGISVVDRMEKINGTQAPEALKELEKPNK